MAIRTRARTLCAGLFLVGLPLAGCGTVTNLVVTPPAAGGKTPFGGVRHDAACIHEAPDAKAAPHPAAVKLACAADLPFSVVGDFVTWPYTAAYTFINRPVAVPPVLHAVDSPPPQPTAGNQPQAAPAPQPPPQPAAGNRPPAAPSETLPQPKTLP